MFDRFVSVAGNLLVRALAVVLFLGACPGFAQDFAINEVSRGPDQRVRVTYPSTNDAYYILERSSDLQAFPEAVGMALGARGTSTLQEASAVPDRALFYRLRQVPLTASLDSDGDGIDDVYELERSGILDPLNDADAQDDPDGNGLTHLQEFLQGGDGRLTTKLTSSPLDGEDGVALTRETVLRFDRALAVGTTIRADQFFAEFAGRRLPGRTTLSADRKVATLFYEDPLPAAARVRVTFRGGSIQDEDGEEIDADGDGIPGGETTIDFDTLSLTTLPDTAVCGRVFASNPQTGADGTTFVNEPLAGVRITVDSMEDELFAITDEMGNFRLQPAPVGRFFVHIDGRQATNAIPEGAYYPFVGKTWTSRAQEEVTVGNIYLPLIVEGTLQATSTLTQTEVRFPNAVLQEFPEFDGVRLTVPPDTLFSDDGSRGGSIGIAPVPPDRLPGTLPQGLDLPLVITVQTDGATNFDQPVPVQFPNLPDPKTGRALSPGARTAIWSFNHDTGRWEVAGPATISADGQWAVSDPGTGIRAPGWHGTNPLCRLTGGGLADKQDPCATERALVQTGAVQGFFAAVLAPIEAVPVLGDSVGTVANFLGAALDCWANGGDAGACVTGFVQAGEMSLIASVGGPVGDTITNGLLAADLAVRSAALEDCLIHERKLRELRMRAPALQNRLFEAARAMQDAVTGNPAWSNAGPGGLQARRIVWDDIMDAAADGELTEAEEREIVDDPVRVLPDDLTPTDIEALIDRIQLVITNGLPPNEITTIRQAAETLRDVYEEALADGWRTPFFVQYEWLEDLAREEAQRLRDARPINVRIRFRLINRTTGFVQRGTTSGQGTFDLLVQPGMPYTVEFVHPETGETGVTQFVAPQAGGTIHLPPTAIVPPGTHLDTDGDGLNDQAEETLGTDATNADTDNDGVLDGAELAQGGDPLGGLPVRTGIIASADTPGTAVDIDALNDLVAVADLEAGVSVFNVFTGMDPTIVAQIGTPGSAQSVALDAAHLLVGNASEGVSVFDIRSLPEVTLIHQLDLGNVIAVSASAGTGYAGTESGLLVKLDLRSGAVLDTLNLQGPIHDLRLDADHLYALTPGTLFTIPLTTTFLRLDGRLPVSSAWNTSHGRMRLAVGGGVGYVVHRRGYDTVNTADPTNLQPITTTQTAQFGWKQVAPNGSGLLVTTRSTNQSFDGPHHVWLYDSADPTLTDVPITELPTPGVARAVSLFNGIAYIADHSAGLQVVNYLAFDSQKRPPQITLSSQPSNNEVEERKAMRVTAAVADDVQVRNVEFYVNDEPFLTDGNFPFEIRFITPPRSGETVLRLKARVSDTGGNATWSDELSFTLTPDSTPPEIGNTAPPDGAYVGGLDSLTIGVNEPLDPSTVHADNVVIVRAGPDGRLGTNDDVTLEDFTVGLNADGDQVFLQPNSTLIDDLYQVTLSDQVADLTGNRLGDFFVTTFRKGPLLVTATQGTPTNRYVASANVGQEIFITGADFTTESEVTFATITTGGTVRTRVVPLTNIAADGRSGVAVVPGDAVTGELQLPNTTTITLQIVPVVTGVSNGGPGRQVTISGTGFAEGRSSVRFGNAVVSDRGPFSNDGIDIWQTGGSNNRLDATVPENGSLPYVVVTDGGSTGVAADVTAVLAQASTGTPRLETEASVNIGEIVRIEGKGFTTATRILTEAISTGGTPYIHTIEPATVDPGGTSLTFILPEASRTGMVSLINAAHGQLLQVVPRITSVSGGRGRTTTLSGSGFTEGHATARFGAVDVTDQGPFSNDGIDVWETGGRNNRLVVTVPEDGDLPYEIITEGGSSGRLTDLTQMESASETGTPADGDQDSANVGQMVTLRGEGYREGTTKVTLEAMTTGGTPYITTIDPTFVNEDGTLLRFSVPEEARTGVAAILSGGNGEPLQIVPRVTAISGGRGRSTTLSGTGFVEGFVTARFGALQVVDQGPFSNDGIDIWETGGRNNRLVVTVPEEGDLPYEIITEGGSSGRLSDLTMLSNQSLTGTPSDTNEASANVHQRVTLVGHGYALDTTQVTLEAMTTGGTPYITTIAPETVSPDGTSLTFVVPEEARTGMATILSGGKGARLQIVPRITAINGGRGRSTRFSGTGFIEGFVTARFGESQVIDEGPFSNDGIDIWETGGRNNRLDVTVPEAGRLPYEIITEGGSSGRVTDLTTITGSALTGTPASVGVASGNVGQSLTFQGQHYQNDTFIALEAMTTSGTPYITTVSPDSVSPDGRMLTFTIPENARTGPASILNGGAARFLQIVPTLNSVSSAAPNANALLTGTGFIEGYVSVDFGNATVTDEGPFSNDGIDIWETGGSNNRLGVTVPSAGSAPVRVTTEGGTSEALSP